MFLHHPSATVSHLVKTLRRWSPCAFLAIVVVACLTVCSNDRVRRLVFGPRAAYAANQMADQESEPVVSSREPRRGRTVRRPAGETATLRDPSLQPAIVAPPLTTAREQHTATQLLNGKLLVAGGRNATGALAAAQLYDPITGSWTNTGGLNAARYGHIAVLLQTGKALVAGGRDTAGNYLTSAELYDPASGLWTPTGNLITGRSRPTATLLAPTSSTSPNGKALVAAGEGVGGVSLRSAELYDPISGLWSPAGSLSNARREHTATLLANGQVLVAGGLNGGVSLRAAEVYNPNANTWSAAGMLRTARSRHTATALVDGRVLVVGGENAGATLASAELYDPSTNLWTLAAGSLSQSRRSHSATLLTNGKVLVAGGFGAAALRSFQIFDPAAQTWGAPGNLADARANHTATLLPNGATLLVGGGLENNSAFLTSVELLEFNSPFWSDADTFSIARELHTTTLLGNGKVLVAGGYTANLAGNQTLSDARLYDPITNSWSATGGMSATRDSHTATLLHDGRVLITGGLRFLGPDSFLVLSTADLYDPATGKWTQTGSFGTSRVYHTATLLPNGKVLVAGGLRDVSLSLAQLYDPATGQWTRTGDMNGSRQLHTATLLPNGKVLVVGGVSGNTVLNTAELYDPSSGSWSRTGAGQLNTARYLHTATLLPNGKVLVTGGIGRNFSEDSAELYDPATGSWTPVNRMSAPRYRHTATLLISGKVLVAGGISGDEQDNANYLDTAELFDPATNTWSQTSRLSDKRAKFCAVLLPGGQVLAVGGVSGFDIRVSAFLDTAERYDPGLGFAEEMRPMVGRVTLAGGVFTLTGVRFQSASEGSSGNSQNSAGNFPVVQLRDAESGQTRVLTPGPGGWSNNSFTAQALSNPPSGYSLLTVISNGVPGPAEAFSSGATGGGIPTVSISGRVTTLSGTGFRATIRLRSSTGEQRVTQTNANGEYSFSGLPTTTAPPATPTPTPTPAPTSLRLLSMSPHAVQAGSGSFQIRLTGSGFTPNSRIQLGSVSFSPSFISGSTTLFATVPASAVANSGFYGVTVINGSSFSNTLCFTVTPSLVVYSLFPTINNLSPSSAPAGTSNLQVTISGQNLNGASARWNGSPRTTIVDSPTSIRMTLTSSDLAFPTSGKISVTGHYGPSNELCFTITPSSTPIPSFARDKLLASDLGEITYTVTPEATTRDGRQVTFSPPSRTYSGLTNDVNNANFLVTGPPVDIDGTVRTPGASPLAQVRVTVTYKDPITDTYQFRDELITDASGVFTFASLPPGYAYRITPQRPSYNFSFPDFSDQPVLDFPNLTASYAGLRCLGQLAIVAPEVTANPATNVTTTTATLRGVVNPNGAGATVKFEYAMNAAFTGSTIVNAPDLPAGGAQPVSVNVTNLKPGRNYFFRIIADNSLNVTSQPEQFSTLPATISGSVRLSYGGRSQPVSGVSLALTGDANQNASSNAAGMFNLTGLSDGDYVIRPGKTGDVNGIFGTDASLVARAFAELVTLNDLQKIAADANGSGVISGSDASLIAKFVADISDPTSVVGQWKFNPASRSYPALSDNLTGANFEAILVGDVNGSWTPPNSLGPRLPTVEPLFSDSMASLFKLNLDSAPKMLAGDQIVRASAQTINVSLPQLTAASGASLTVPITVGDLTGRGVNAYDFTLTFNQNTLQLQNPAFDQTGAISGAMTIIPNTTTPGQLRLVAFGISDLTGTGTLLNLKFNVVGAAGSSSPLTLQVFNFNEGNPQANRMNGSVTVIGPPLVTTSAATNVTTTTATLNGSVNPNGGATMAFFEWGTNSNLSSPQTTPPQSIPAGNTAQPISASITGLSPNTTYFFRAVATNSAGPANGSILNFTTQAACPTVTSINPASGTVGSTVTVTGTNFTGITGVRFSNNVPATPANLTDTSFNVVVPTGAITGPITISKAGCPDTQTASFTVLPSLTLSFGVPSLNVLAGESQNVALKLSAAQGSDIAVSLNSANAAVASVPAMVTIPAGMTEVPVSVTGVAVGGPVTITATAAGGATANLPVRVVNIAARVVNAAGLAGGMASVPIQLVSPGGVNAIGFSIQFDSAVLTNAQATAGPDAPNAQLQINDSQLAQGRLGLIMALSAGQQFAAGSRQIVTVNFNIPANASVASTPITFVNQPTPMEVSDSVANLLPAAFIAGNVAIAQGVEADVAPRPGGNGSVTTTDWVQVGRFVGGLDTITPAEFQRADCAPRLADNGVTPVLGDGLLSVRDWVQAGRYAAGLDPPTGAGGPTAQASASLFFSPSLIDWRRRDNPLDATGSRVLRLTRDSYGVSRTHSVAVELDAAGDESALGFSLTFDPARWRLVSIAAGRDARAAQFVFNANDAAIGRVGVVMALPPGESLVAGVHQLVTLSFASLSPGGAQFDQVGFGDEPVAREITDAEANLLPASFALNDDSPLTIVSSANFDLDILASESLATAFGRDLAGATLAAETQPLPTILGGTRVIIRNSQGVEHLAPILFVSPGQINFQVPAETAFGPALVTITDGNHRRASAVVRIERSAPALFAADASGHGLAAGVVMRLRSDGSASFNPLALFDPLSRKFIAEPIEPARDASERVFLLLFGTGVRGGEAKSAIIGGVPVEITYAGAQGSFAGLDQINIPLTRETIGRGELDVVLIVDGKKTNAARVHIK